MTTMACQVCDEKIEFLRTDAVVIVSTLSALLKRFIEPKR